MVGNATGQSALCPLPPNSPNRRRDIDSNLFEDSVFENVDIPGIFKKVGIKLFKIGKVRILFSSRALTIIDLLTRSS